MKEIKALEGVSKFHKTFNQYTGSTPSFPDEKVCDLRINLLQEELNEFKEGIKNKDIVEVADALIDLQYVLSGAILAFGLQDKAHDLFEEVQRSNMSKLCYTEQEAIDTQKWYKENKGFNSYIVENEEDYVWMVKRVEDDKLLKNIYYSEANLKEVLGL